MFSATRTSFGSCSSWVPGSGLLVRMSWRYGERRSGTFSVRRWRERDSPGRVAPPSQPDGMVYSGAEGMMMLVSVGLGVAAVDGSVSLRYLERDSPGRTMGSGALADSGDSL